MNINNEFASARLTAGQLNAIVKKMGGYEKALAFLSGKITVSEPIRSWREQDGVIYFTVVSNRKTGQEWMDYFTSKGNRISIRAKQLLLSDDFKNTITNKVVTEMAVLKGMLFNDGDRTIDNIRAEARKRNWSAPNAEDACLIRDMFTDEDLKTMGLFWLITMHKPIEDSGGGPGLLSANRDGDGGWLRAYCDEPGHRFYRGGGFAFTVSQVVLES